MNLLSLLLFISNNLIVTNHKESLTDNSTNLLERLIFLNNGTVYSSDTFVWKRIPIYYLESQNVTDVMTTWGDHNYTNYLYKVSRGGGITHPPSGMRSSVQLGGVSTGAIELRADGSFHEWTIMNQTPAGAAKIQVLEDFLFGIRTTLSSGVTQCRVLKTHARTPFKPVDSITYSGEYPVSRLEFQDSKIPLKTVLYAYSSFEINNLNESANPAISFTFKVFNPLNESVNLALMFNLPFGIEPLTQRVHTPTGKRAIPISVYSLHSKSQEDQDTWCYFKCVKNKRCKSWTVFHKPSKCLLYSTVNLNSYSDGASAGIKGMWETDTQHANKLFCLTLNRQGQFAPNGNISACIPKSSSYKVSYTTSKSFDETWSGFSKNGFFHRSFSKNVDSFTSPSTAISVNKTLKSGENTSFQFLLAWNFPNRDFNGKVYGNYYSHVYPTSLASAEHMFNNTGRILKNIQNFHETFLSSSLPSFLADMLVNSVSHVRWVMWFADGRWRQWEANDCTNIDSVHNDGERHIPYIMFLPDSTRNKIRGWASSQLKNGMIAEQLRVGCFGFSKNPKIDVPGGRRMSDVSSMFIVYILELYLWANDTNMLDKYWPNVKRAAEWHIDQAKEYGTLTYIINTYDGLFLDQYKFASYNSAFHILALMAASKLARAKGDEKFASLCDQYSNLGQVSMEKFLWNDTKGYFNAYSDGSKNNPGAIMTDTFYAQVLAFSLGLGPLINQTKLLMHMKAEFRINTTPVGMLVLTGRHSLPGKNRDNSVWQMGNPNWATISIHLNQSVNQAFDVAKVTLDRWRSVINDQWNVAGITGGQGYGAEGMPYTTSHYGFFMSVWHILMALSGQVADLPNETLKFRPKLDCPFKLPVILPGVLAELKCKTTMTSDENNANVNKFSASLLVKRYEFVIKVGSLRLKTLSVGGSIYPKNRISLKAYQCLVWDELK